MTTLLSLLAPALAVTAPMLLLVIGLVPTKTANTNPRLMTRAGITGAWLAFICALAAVVLHGFDSTRSWTLFSVTLPGNIGAFSIGTYINAVTVIMLVLVSFVGAVVSRYARNYLDGDANQGGFYKWFSLTLASIMTLIVSGNLLMFSLAWIATSLCLHQLLMFYPQRPAAVLAAHKKFIASRIGGIPEVITDGVDGFLIEPGNAQALREKMMWMVAHPAQAVDMGLAGRKKLETYFGPETYYEKLIKVYQSVS